MATNLSIIKRALRKISVLPGGKEPTSDQASDAMTSLQGLISELIGIGSFGRLNDVLATANYTANEFERIRCSVGVAVTLPTTITTDAAMWADLSGSTWPGLTSGMGPIDYGFGNNGLPRPPYDRAPVVVISSAGVATYSIYNAYQGAWVTINGMTEQGTFPFADYLEEGFAAMLSERVAEDYDQQIGQNTARQAAACRFMLSNKMDSQRRVGAADYY